MLDVVDRDYELKFIGHMLKGLSLSGCMDREIGYLTIC